MHRHLKFYVFYLKYYSNGECLKTWKRNFIEAPENMAGARTQQNSATSVGDGTSPQGCGAVLSRYRKASSSACALH